jgi:MFS family permease
VFGMSQWLPSFFVRTHDMSVKSVAAWFGTTFGLGMMTGALVGGAWATRIARRHPLTLHLSVLGCFAIGPANLEALWSPLAIAMVFVAAFASALTTPSVAAAGQPMIDPRVRAMGQAIQNFFNATVGFGLGVLLVGMLSDALRAGTGEDSLRWALSLSQIISVIAGATFVIAMRKATTLSGLAKAERILVS